MRNIKRSVLSASVLALALGVAGCASNPSNQDVGRIVGTITGVGIGSMFGGGNGQTLSMVVGGIAGYMIGDSIGRNMDMIDQERAGRLLYRGVEQSQPGVYHDSWRNRQNMPVESRVIVEPYYQDYDLRLCRSFTQETTIRIGGQLETAVQHGIACFTHSRQYPQGIWVVQPN